MRDGYPIYLPSNSRVIASIEMSRILQNQKSVTFAGFVTGDESWFFLEHSRNRVWRLGDENAPEKISQETSTEKHMLAVFWSTAGHWLRNDYWIVSHIIAGISVKLLFHP
jgi:hypothetical protein